MKTPHGLQAGLARRNALDEASGRLMRVHHAMSVAYHQYSPETVHTVPLSRTQAYSWDEDGNPVDDAGQGPYFIVYWQGTCPDCGLVVRSGTGRILSSTEGVD